MAKAAGRRAALKKNSVVIGGVLVTTIKWAGESIDVTDRDSSGIVELLPDVKTQQITLDVEGYAKDSTLRDIVFDTAAAKLLTDITFVFADALAAKDTITGNFFVTGFEEGNPHDGAASFKASFVSSGAWTLG
jgi:predicted secreted protein